MALPATILSNYGQSNLDTSVNNAAVGISPAGQFFTLVALGGLLASGATLTFEGSTDNGATWAAVSATQAISRVTGSAVTADGLYKLPTGTRTHFRLRVSSVGSGPVTVAAVGGSTPQDVLSVDGSGNPVGAGGGGTASSVSVTNFPGTQTVVQPTTTYAKATAASSLVVKASAGSLTVASALSVTAGFLIAIDATGAPTSGAALTGANAPIALPWSIVANVSFIASYTDAPIPVTTGLVLLVSSSATVYTPVSATFIHGGAR